MPDFGSLNTTVITPAGGGLHPISSLIYTFVPYANYDFGSFQTKAMAGTGGTAVEYIDRIIYTPVEPSSRGVGDWLLVFHNDEVSNVRETLYMVPAMSVAVVREIRLHNTTTGVRTVTIWQKGYPEIVKTLQAGELYKEKVFWVIGSAGLIEGLADAIGVNCAIEGVEEVMA